MSSQQRSTLRVQLDFFILTDIDFCKVVFIELIVFQHITTVQNLLVFQFRLRTEYIPCSVEGLVLSSNGLCLSLVFGSQLVDVLVQIGNSLIEFGYVRKDDQTGLFSVTLKVVQLGAMVSSKIDMVETGRSYMRELVATFDQATVSFATFMDKQVLVLRREYPRNCVTRIDLSQQLPAYCTGLGKALLSTKSEEEIDEYIATVPRTAYTLHTLTDGARLKQDLLAAKEKGYAEDISEISDSLHCVAVPILTPHGGLWAISLSGHCSVIREYGVENIVKHLKKAVWDMTSGYSAAPVA